jgi:hypothetical protein
MISEHEARSPLMRLDNYLTASEYAKENCVGHYGTDRDLPANKNPVRLLAGCLMKTKNKVPFVTHFVGKNPQIQNGYTADVK